MPADADGSIMHDAEHLLSPGAKLLMVSLLHDHPSLGSTKPGPAESFCEALDHQLCTYSLELCI